MLELRNVSKRFAGSLAVDNVSFRARPGEVTGYLGPNGSGKSTTMKMIVGLIEATSGAIVFDGRSSDDDVIGWKQRIGYVPEEPHLYSHLSGLEYLVMVAQLRDLPATQAGDRIDGLLRLLTLYDDRHVSISAYSKGMRQKVLLAAALLHNPALLLLDEPFSGLDVGSALVLRDLPIGLTYAVWAAVGTALIAAIGIFAFGEPATTMKLLSLALIIAGTVGLNVAGSH